MYHMNKNTQPLHDYFRSAAQLFIEWVYNYEILTTPALLELAEQNEIQFNKKLSDQYEDYRQILRILQSVGRVRIYLDIKKQIPFSTRQVINNDPEIQKYLKHWGGYDGGLEKLRNLGNIDAHHVSVQEQNYAQQQTYVQEFIGLMKTFLEGCPIPANKDQTTKTKVVKALAKLLKQLSDDSY